MKRTVLLITLLSLTIFVVPQTRGADEKTPPPANAVNIPPAQKQAIVSTYNTLMAANKDFQIAILQARVACKVDETWVIDLNTMTFAPPPPEKKETKK